MLKNLCKNVLYVKDIQSNVIEEAFFILKNNDIKNIKVRNELAMSEISDIIDVFSTTINKNLKEKQLNAQKETRKMKVIASICIGAIMVSCLILAINNFM